jgi:hypothetical protein
MTDNPTAGNANGLETVGEDPPKVSAVEATGVYEVDDGVVFYDVDNPLAWVQTREAVTLAEMT